MNIKINMFFWSLNNEFANTLQKVRFCPIFSSGRVLEASIFLRYVTKNGIFRVQIVGGCLQEHKVFIKDFMFFWYMYLYSYFSHEY